MSNIRQGQGQYSIYKSVGAAQFKFIPPEWVSKPNPRDPNRPFWSLEKEGCVLLEAAPGNKSKDKPAWDWSDGVKIKFAIGMPDIVQLLETKDPGSKVARIRGPEDPSLRVFHDNNGTSKTLEILPGQGDYAGTYNLKIGEKPPGGQMRSITVPLSAGEHSILMHLLKTLSLSIVGLQ